VADDAIGLAVDTASDLASIALAREDALIAELTWQCGRDHARQLLPAIDDLLRRQALSKEDLGAVFVCTGPGAYAGLRVGVSTAKGLAFGLGLPIAGVGRLEIEAYAAAAGGAPVVAVHRAGRADLAWAAYEGTRDQDRGTGPHASLAAGWREVIAPRLVAPEALAGALPDGATVAGDIDDERAAQLERAGHRVVRGAATLRRASLLAELGWARLRAGRADDPKSLEPVYLREPAIGPQ
jgi:tRNA threonylcarbamoyladenosine biosynthesis protein TsaB